MKKKKTTSKKTIIKNKAIQRHIFHANSSKKTKNKENKTEISDKELLKKWVRIALWGSGISVILGFLIYKSFFFLGAFLPLSVYGVWYIIKHTKKHIEKFDILSK